MQILLTFIIIRFQNFTMTESSMSRYSGLIKCIDAFIESIHDKHGTCRMLAKSFPRCNQECSEALMIISDQLWKNFSDNLKSHSMTLIHELELEQLLDRLENERQSDIGWGFSGRPRNDIKAVLSSIKNKEVLALESMVEASQAEVEMLKQQLTQKEDRTKKLMEDAASQMQEIEKMEEIVVRASEGFPAILCDGNNSHPPARSR